MFRFLCVLAVVSIHLVTLSAFCAIGAPVNSGHVISGCLLSVMTIVLAWGDR